MWPGPARPGAHPQLDADGKQLSGDKPSKEVFMHRACIAAAGQRRRGASAFDAFRRHRLPCRRGPGDALPPLTPYFVMRVGRLPVIRTTARRSDDGRCGGEAGRQAHAVLLANHGPVVAGTTLDDAVGATEELEEAARLALLLRQGRPAADAGAGGGCEETLPAGIGAAAVAAGHPAGSQFRSMDPMPSEATGTGTAGRSADRQSER